MCCGQGDLINSIEHHVLEAGEAVEVAKVQTRKAIRYKGKARKVKAIFATSNDAYVERRRSDKVSKS